MNKNREQFNNDLIHKYGNRIKLISINDAVALEEELQFYCTDCGLYFCSSYKRLFHRDTIKGCIYCRHNKKHRVFGFTNELFLFEARTKWVDRFQYKALDVKPEIRAEEQEIT